MFEGFLSALGLAELTLPVLMDWQNYYENSFITKNSLQVRRIFIKIPEAFFVENSYGSMKSVL